MIRTAEQGQGSRMTESIAPDASHVGWAMAHRSFFCATQMRWAKAYPTVCVP